MTSFRRIAVAALVASCTFACGKDDPAPPAAPADELSYELFPSTRELQPAQLEALTSSTEDGTLTFAVEPAGFEDVEVGDVLLAGTSQAEPLGLLRIVAGIERADGGLVLHTMGAPLQLAFRKLHVKMERAVATAEGTFVPAPGLRVIERRDLKIGGGDSAKKRFEIVLYDGDDDPSTKMDQVEIDATLGGGYRWSLSVDVDWDDVFDVPAMVKECFLSLLDQEPCTPARFLPEVKATFAVNPTVSLDVNVVGAASLDFDKELEVGENVLPPIFLGPLVFVPTLDVLAQVKGGASARFEVGVSAGAELESTASISSKHMGSPQFTAPRISDWHFDTKDPVIDLHARAEAKVGARLGVSLYGVAGPYATTSAFAAIDAAPFDDPCWRLHMGIEAELGGRLTSPRLPLFGYIELLDWRVKPFRPLDEEVASGSCLVPPDPPLPPGGGPTAPAFRQPEFTPWAKILGGSVEGTSTPIGVITAGSPHLEPSIDGRWISTGRFARALHKVDGEGKLVWTSRLVDTSDREMRPTRSVPTADAGLIALLKPQETEAFALARLTQGGGLVWGRSYGLPDDCAAEATHLFRDAGAGFYVLGLCATRMEGWFVHLDGRGDVVRARYLGEEGALQVRPTAGTIVEGEAILTGTLGYAGGAPEWAFIGRFDAEDLPAPATAFSCAARTSITPIAAVPAENGGVTVVGEANGPGFVARIRKDGEVGFVRFPNMGLGVRDWFSISSVAELPITGMVVAASREKTGGAAPSVVVAGLDGAGRTRWARDYSIDSRSLTWPAARITDDGGVLVAAVAGPTADREGDLVAMKVFALDGTLGDGQPVQGEDVTLESYDCPYDHRSVAFQLGELPVTTKALGLRRR